MASGKDANKLVAQIRPRGDGIYWQVHQPRPEVGLEHQWEVVGEHLAVPSPGSLHRNGVNAQELGRMSLAVVLLRDLWFERAGSGPLEPPQLTGKSWTTYLVRQVTRIPRRRPVRSGPCTPIRLMACFPSPLDGSSSVLFNPLLKNLTLVAMSSWIGRCRGSIIMGIDPLSWRPLLSWWRGVHHSCGASGPSAISTRRLDGPTQRRARHLVSIFFGVANKALDSSPPLFLLLRSRREVEE